MHGDEVKMGETVLSFHIHPGTDTCDGCEPGQVMAHINKYKREENTGEPPHEKLVLSPSVTAKASDISFFCCRSVTMEGIHKMWQ